MTFEIAVFLATIICLVIGAFWVRSQKHFGTGGFSFSSIVETIIVMLSSFVIVISILKLLSE